MRIALTADLHWGHDARGAEATRLLFTYLHQHPPDILVVAGDVGTGTLFGDCLAQMADLPSLKTVLPGNHDLWVKFEADYDSLFLYDEELPRIAAQHGFRYLDHSSLILPELAVVGSINWYDYSWSLEKLRTLYPEELHRLESKRFSRGKHNDANFVRWQLDDAGFTTQVVAAFERHLLAALEQAPCAIVAVHHPPIYDLGFPRPEPASSLDGLLWDAFCGNRRMEELLARHAARIRFLFCGHTHRERETVWHGIRGYNIGGDYHFKRLLELDWETGEVVPHQFGEPG